MTTIEEQIADVLDRLTFAGRALLLGSQGAVSDEEAGRLIDLQLARIDGGSLVITAFGDFVRAALQGKPKRTVKTQRARRADRRLEKQEQTDIVALLRSMGAAVYVIGTRRPAGKPCPKCKTFVAEHQGTCQTPGIPDLLVFLKNPVTKARTLAFIEVKRDGGRRSVAQDEFRAQALASASWHFTGTLDDVIRQLTAAGFLNRASVPAHHFEGKP